MDRSELEEAFRHAVYCVRTRAGPRQFRIGERIDGLDGISFAMFTAYNPGGKERAYGNRAANARLREALSELPYTITDGFSHDGRGMHREPHFGVFGIGEDQALALAARFGQAAIVWFDGHTAELAWTDEEQAPPVSGP